MMTTEKKKRGRPPKAKPILPEKKKPVGRPPKLTKYEQYIQDVIDRRVLVCDATYKAVKRHVDEIAIRNSEYEFVAKEADKVIDFIESLEIYEGKYAGQKLKLDNWQAFIIAMLFGWKRRKDGRRRFKKAFISLGRGNGKTPLAAAMSITALLKDNGAQIYSIATTYQQAALSLNWVKNFVARNEELSEIIRCYDKSVFYEKKFSVFRALSKSFKGFDGFNPSFVIADEVAAMPDYELLGVMETALHKREDSLLVMITTANTVNINSPGLAEYDYSKKVLDGVVKDDRYFAIVYELDKEDDWKNVRLYEKANPASWINMQELREAKQEAENNKLKEKSFRTKNLNTWMIGTNNEWIPLKVWDIARKNKETLGQIKLEGRPCAIGADFSERRDLTVYTLAFWIKEVQKVFLQHHVYIPQDTLASREATEASLFGQWVRSGTVKLCEGEYIDKDQVVSDILEDIKKYKINLMAYDPNMALEYEEKLRNEIKLIPVNQDMKTFSPATQDFEELIRNGNVIDDSEIMRWCISNAVVYQNNKMIKVKKVSKDSQRRIDCIISSILAYSQLRLIIAKTEQKKRDISTLSRLIY